MIFGKIDGPDKWKANGTYLNRGHPFLGKQTYKEQLWLPTAWILILYGFAVRRRVAAARQRQGAVWRRVAAECLPAAQGPHVQRLEARLVGLSGPTKTNNII